MEELATKDYLAAQFAEQNAFMDARFSKLEAKMEANFTILRWMIGIVMAAVLIPLIQQLLVF